jgi:iron uptake system EfeUOB component EfeO/EfeM
MKWEERETRVVLCGMHQLQYVMWHETDLEFVKKIATPLLLDSDSPRNNKVVGLPKERKENSSSLLTFFRAAKPSKS